MTFMDRIPEQGTGVTIGKKKKKMKNSVHDRGVMAF